MNGDLDANSFRAVIAAGRSLYADGSRDLLLDLSGVSLMSSSGIVALHSLALIPPAQRPPLVIVCNFAEPREQGYLEQLAKQLGVMVQFRMLVSDEELVRLYNQALLTLYTPVMEPFGFVPIESMACGTPVVGVREAGVRETVLHGETGLLTERDPCEFAEATVQLLNDGERRSQYGQRGRAYVQQQWQWDRCVRELEEHFAAMASQSQGRKAA